jgi:nucleotide-binding universal stress UspA family protein
MSYKTILVHVDAGDMAPVRIRCAARLARSVDAHLIGAAPTGISRFVPPEVLAAGLNPLAARCRTLRQEAREALDRFSLLAQQEGVLSYEARLLDDDVDGGLPMAARYCDLAVAGLPNRMLVDAMLPADLPEQLALYGGHPVLVVPDTGGVRDFSGQALIAWDGSAAATRAVAGALPLLRRARSVEILGLGDNLPATCIPQETCTALAAWLGRHGIAAHTCRKPQPAHISEALLAEAIDIGATLLVMGAYGHSRLREALKEGVTSTVLRWTHIPLLLAH